MFGRQVAVLLRARPSVLLCQHDISSRVLLAQPRRLYATPGRPKKAVGEPSRTVKRAVKKTATKPAATEAPAKRKSVAKAAGTKKPAKKAAKKPAAKKKPAKKVLTEEQAAARKERLATKEIKQLKIAALKPPKLERSNAWSELMREKAKDGPFAKGVSASESKELLGQHSKNVAAAYKSLSPAELEHYNHLSHTRRDESTAAYKAWVESHTQEQIHTANLARVQLRRKAPRKKHTTSWPPIKDDRQAKRPLSAYIQFSIERNKSGDFSHILVRERSKLIGQEWKALSESEKKKYKDLASEDTSRYVSEYSETYGHAPPSYNNGGQQVASATAG